MKAGFSVVVGGLKLVGFVYLTVFMEGVRVLGNHRREGVCTRIGIKNVRYI
jgi:hypothetical protein